MKTLVAFLLGGLIAGGLVYWVVNPARERVSPQSHQGAAQVENGVSSGSWDGETMKGDLKRTGEAMREKAERAGDAIGDAAANVKLTAAVKGNLVKESGLSALAIDVDSTDGVVTLSGAVESQEQVALAVKRASETDGVRKVISTLQVKPAQ